MSKILWVISLLLALAGLVPTLAFASLLLLVSIPAAILANIMARNRGRSRTLYTVWSLSLPLFTLLLLLVLGRTPARHEADTRRQAEAFAAAAKVDAE